MQTFEKTLQANGKLKAPVFLAINTGAVPFGVDDWLCQSRDRLG